MKIFQTMISIVLLGMLVSCEDEAKNKLTKAQACLDKATAGTALSCLSDLQGIDTTQAYALRCAARFVANGITEATLVDAMKTQSSSGSSGNPVLGMIGVLSFKGAAPRAASALAMDDCSKSGISAYSLFASMADMATVLGSAGGSTLLTTLATGEQPTQVQMEEALDNLCGWAPDATDKTTCVPSSEEDVAAIGSAAAVANDTYCGADSTDNSFCTDLSAVLADPAITTDAQIGQALLEKFAESSSSN